MLNYQDPLENVGQSTKYVEENPALANFFLSENDFPVDAPHSLVGESTPGNEPIRNITELADQQTNSNQPTILQQNTELGENTDLGEETTNQNMTDLINTPASDNLDKSLPQNERPIDDL